jgi:Spy/CpxP family protein refolding chaperone
MMLLMINLKALAIVAAGMFAVGSLSAGEACCAKGGEMKQAKSECGMSFADLNLTKEQEEKMKAAAADCKKGGCSEESMAKMNQQAEQILNETQYASWKEHGGCNKKTEKDRS